MKKRVDCHIIKYILPPQSNIFKSFTTYHPKMAQNSDIKKSEKGVLSFFQDLTRKDIPISVLVILVKFVGLVSALAGGLTIILCVIGYIVDNSHNNFIGISPGIRSTPEYIGIGGGFLHKTAHGICAIISSLNIPREIIFFSILIIFLIVFLLSLVFLFKEKNGSLN